MRYKSLQLLLFAIFCLVSIDSVGQSLNPFNIGALSPGDSIVINYDVTINNPCGCMQISNQGSVSGSNFVTLNTDDPSTAALGDPTITPLNMFPLTVSLYEIRAAKTGTGITVSWIVASEINMLKYEVERSTDGRSFAKIGEVSSINSTSTYTYSLLDPTPAGGANYYRLRLIDRGASPKYSSIVRVDLSGKNSGVVLYPNPVREKQITVQLNNLEKGLYRIRFYNNTGQEVFSRTIDHNGGSVSKAILLPPSFTPGVFHVKVIGERASFIQSMIVQ